MAVTFVSFSLKKFKGLTPGLLVTNLTHLLNMNMDMPVTRFKCLVTLFFVVCNGSSYCTIFLILYEEHHIRHEAGMSPPLILTPATGMATVSTPMSTRSQAHKRGP